jgi:hypothetical protein
MKPNVLVLTLLAFVSLACLVTGQGTTLSVADPTPTPSPSPSAAPSPSPLPSSTPAVLQVCAENLNIREAADSNAVILGLLKSGDQLTWTLERQTAPDNGVWLKVSAGGITGWVNSRFLCEQTP